MNAEWIDQPDADRPWNVRLMKRQVEWLEPLALAQGTTLNIFLRELLDRMTPEDVQRIWDRQKKKGEG
jgi:hypothetical protein